jgi:phosphatidate cytidylyltransferase
VILLKNYSNLAQRIITAIIGAAFIVGGILYNEWTYFAVFFLICFLTLREFYALAGLDGMVVQKTFGTLCGMSIFALSFLIENKSISYRYYFLIFPLISCVYMIKLYKKFERKPFTNIAFTFLGIFYVAIPYALLNIAVFENGMYNYEIIFGCLFILWASDTLWQTEIVRTDIPQEIMGRSSRGCHPGLCICLPDEPLFSFSCGLAMVHRYCHYYRRRHLWRPY